MSLRQLLCERFIPDLARIIDDYTKLTDRDVFFEIMKRDVCIHFDAVLTNGSTAPMFIRRRIIHEQIGWKRPKEVAKDTIIIAHGRWDFYSNALRGKPNTIWQIIENKCLCKTVLGNGFYACPDPSLEEQLMGVLRNSYPQNVINGRPI